jgi:hypothetical protein
MNRRQHGSQSDAGRHHESRSHPVQRATRLCIITIVQLAFAGCVGADATLTNTSLTPLNDPSTCCYLMAQWEAVGGGMARVHVFDHRLNGVGYLTQCLEMGPDPGDLYESAKFGNRSCDLMLSDGAQAT